MGARVVARRAVDRGGHGRVDLESGTDDGGGLRADRRCGVSRVAGVYHLRAEGRPADRFPLDADYAQAFTNPIWVQVGTQPIRNRAAAEYRALTVGGGERSRAGRVRPRAGRVYSVKTSRCVPKSAHASIDSRRYSW